MTDLEDTDDTPWISKHRSGSWEVHTPCSQKVQILCAANYPIVINKMYGPLGANPLRITLKYDKEHDGLWVVEYQNPTTNQWEVKTSFSCQENWPDSTD